MNDPAKRAVIEGLEQAEESRRTDPGTVVASRLEPWRNAYCLTCFDLGWVSREKDPLHTEAIPCPNCAGPRRKEKAIKAALNAAGVPDAARIKTLESFKLVDVADTVQEAFNAARAFVLGDAPPWLCLTGPKGCGKTHLGYACAIAFAASEWEARYFTAGALVNVLHSAINPDSEEGVESLVKYMSNVHLLVLDELGQTTVDNWALGQIEELLGARYEGLKLTILLSNLEPTGNYGLKGWSGRLYSRLQDRSVCRLVDMVDAKDYRPRLRR